MFSTIRLEPIIVAAKEDGTVEYKPLVTQDNNSRTLMDIFLPREETAATYDLGLDWPSFFSAESCA